eukprot:3663523-Pyramimonas_sp.AAC.2
MSSRSQARFTPPSTYCLSGGDVRVDEYNMTRVRTSCSFRCVDIRQFFSQHRPVPRQKQATLHGHTIYPPTPRTLAPCTLHPAPCTLHPAPCTPHTFLSRLNEDSRLLRLLHSMQ